MPQLRLCHDFVDLLHHPRNTTHFGRRRLDFGRRRLNRGATVACRTGISLPEGREGFAVLSSSWCRRHFQTRNGACDRRRTVKGNRPRGQRKRRPVRPQHGLTPIPPEPGLPSNSFHSSAQSRPIRPAKLRADSESAATPMAATAARPKYSYYRTTSSRPEQSWFHFASGELQHRRKSLLHEISVLSSTRRLLE